MNPTVPTESAGNTLVQRLTDAGHKLSPDLRQAILAEGHAVVPALIRLLEDESLAMMDAPGGGHVPMHAADLLHELRAPEAIEPMLRELGRGDSMSIIHDQIVQYLPDFGASVFEPAWAMYVATDDEDVCASLRSVMADLGIRDPRILSELVADLDDHPERGAIHLAAYGDPAAVPHLQDAMLMFSVDETPVGVFANHALIEFKAAIESLGGELTPGNRAQLARADASRRGAFAELKPSPALPVRSATKVGRNHPCPCGSGKKYKKCCVGKT